MELRHLSGSDDDRVFTGQSGSPQNTAEATEKLANVMKEYFACLENNNGALVLSGNGTQALLASVKNASGSASAHYNLGVLYETGMYFTKDLEKAVMHYKAAADMGHPKATYNLGVMYVKGHGSADIGLSLLKKASSMGVPQAMTFVAYKYLEEGHIDKAAPLLKEAVAANDPNAALYLKLCRERGADEVQDKEEKEE